MASSGGILNAVSVSSYPTSLNTSSFTAVSAHTTTNTTSSTGISSVTAAAAGALIKGVSSATAPVTLNKIRAEESFLMEQSCSSKNQSCLGVMNNTSPASDSSSSSNSCSLIGINHSCTQNTTVSFSTDDKAQKMLVNNSEKGSRLDLESSLGTPTDPSGPKQVSLSLSNCVTAVSNSSNGPDQQELEPVLESLCDSEEMFTLNTSSDQDSDCEDAGDSSSCAEKVSDQDTDDVDDSDDDSVQFCNPDKASSANEEDSSSDESESDNDDSDCDEYADDSVDESDDGIAFCNLEEGEDTPNVYYGDRCLNKDQNDRDTDSNANSEENSDSDSEGDSDTNSDSDSVSPPYDSENDNDTDDDSDDGIEFGDFDGMDSDDDLGLGICPGDLGLSPANAIKKNKSSKLAEDEVDSFKPPKKVVLSDSIDEDDSLETMIWKANRRWQRFYSGTDVTIQSKAEVVSERLPHKPLSKPQLPSTKPLKSSLKQVLKFGSTYSINYSHSSVQMTSLSGTRDIHVGHHMASVHVVQTKDVCYEESVTISAYGFNNKWNKLEEGDEKFRAAKISPAPKVTPSHHHGWLPNFEDLLFSSSSKPQPSSNLAFYCDLSRNPFQSKDPGNLGSKTASKSSEDQYKFSLPSGTCGQAKRKSSASEQSSSGYDSPSMHVSFEEDFVLGRHGLGSHLNLAAPNNNNRRHHHHHDIATQPLLSSSSSIYAGLCDVTRRSQATLPLGSVPQLSSASSNISRHNCVPTHRAPGKFKRVVLNVMAQTHLLRTYAFALDQLRHDHYWTQCAVDRQRFNSRIEAQSRTLLPVLTKEHREKVWARLHAH